MQIRALAVPRQSPALVMKPRGRAAKVTVSSLLVTSVICVFSYLFLFNLMEVSSVLSVFGQMTFDFIDFLLFFCFVIVAFILAFIIYCLLLASNSVCSYFPDSLCENLDYRFKFSLFF